MSFSEAEMVLSLDTLHKVEPEKYGKYKIAQAYYHDPNRKLYLGSHKHHLS
jgi:hypothetical protein